MNLKLMVLLVIVLIPNAACVSTRSADSYTIKAVVIRNVSSSEISDTQIRVEKTRELFSCSYVLRETECSTEFRVRKYAGNKIKIYWKQRGIQYVAGLVMSVPSGMKKEIPMSAIVEIRDSGESNSYLTQ